MMMVSTQCRPQPHSLLQQHHQAARDRRLERTLRSARRDWASQQAAAAAVAKPRLGALLTFPLLYLEHRHGRRPAFARFGQRPHARSRRWFGQLLAQAQARLWRGPTAHHLRRRWFLRSQRPRLRKTAVHLAAQPGTCCSALALSQTSLWRGAGLQKRQQRRCPAAMAQAQAKLVVTSLSSRSRCQRLQHLLLALQRRRPQCQPRRHRFLRATLRIQRLTGAERVPGQTGPERVPGLLQALLERNHRRTCCREARTLQICLAAALLELLWH